MNLTTSNIVESKKLKSYMRKEIVIDQSEKEQEDALGICRWVPYTQHISLNVEGSLGAKLG